MAVESPSSPVSTAHPPKRGSTFSALKNFAWLVGDKMLSVVVGLLVFGVIARVYGPVGSGHFAFGMAILQTALGLSLVCSAAAVLPRFHRQKQGIGGAVANVFAVRLVSSVTAAALIAIYVAFTVENPDRRLAALVLLAATPLIEPFYAAMTYWQSRNDNRLPVLSRASGLAVRAVIVVIAAWFHAPLWAIALAWCVEAALSATIQTLSMRRLASLRQLASTVTALRTKTYFKFGVRFLLGLWLSHLYLRLDRLILSELMPERDFGIYATAMQLLEVWLQVANIVGVAIGPAFLFAQLAKARSPWDLWRVTGMLAGIGVLGLAGAALLGKPVLHLVFGTQFEASYPYLVAGTAFGVLYFADQVVQLAISAANQPAALAIKWAVACIAALIAQIALFSSIGAYAGPAGLAIGMAASWLALLVWHSRRPISPANS
jgi:O-antigen/teichoic acid export membrane protein